MKRLDLHGIKHEDVRSKVINFVEDNWGGGDDLEFVTGHSPKMKELVGEVLSEYNLTFDGSCYHPVMKVQADG